jgi:hypothetical protein
VAARGRVSGEEEVGAGAGQRGEGKTRNLRAASPWMGVPGLAEVRDNGKGVLPAPQSVG